MDIFIKYLKNIQMAIKIISRLQSNIEIRIIYIHQKLFHMTKDFSN